MSSHTVPEAPVPSQTDDVQHQMSLLVRSIHRPERTSYFQMPEGTSTIRYTDLMPGFESDAQYQRWADHASGSLIIEKGLVDLEDALSVLALMLRLRHMAEVDDRRFFALSPEEALRRRYGYPGEGWELVRLAEDRPNHSLVPTVLVTSSPKGRHIHLYRHADDFEIGRARKYGSVRRLTAAELENAVGEPVDEGFGRVFDMVDFSQRGPGNAHYLRYALINYAWHDDDDWFAAHPGQPVRERFVCPGELRLHHGGMEEYVEVRRLNGLLWHVLLHDGETPQGVGWGLTDSVAPEHYAPSRLYPCHGVR